MSGILIIYDFPSENRPALRGKWKKIVRTTRVKATKRLYALGVPCIESIILIPEENSSKVEAVAQEVIDTYHSVLEQIRAERGIELPKPIIKVLRVAQEQFEVFQELAKKRLAISIDAYINQVSAIIENSSKNIVKKESTLNWLRKLRKEWTRTREYSNMLGLGLEDKIDHLLNLIQKAINQLRG